MKIHQILVLLHLGISILTGIKSSYGMPAGNDEGRHSMFLAPKILENGDELTEHVEGNVSDSDNLAGSIDYAQPSNGATPENQSQVVIGDKEFAVHHHPEGLSVKPQTTPLPADESSELEDSSFVPSQDIIQHGNQTKPPTTSFEKVDKETLERMAKQIFAYRPFIQNKTESDEDSIPSSETSKLDRETVDFKGAPVVPSQTVEAFNAKSMKASSVSNPSDTPSTESKTVFRRKVRVGGVAAETTQRDVLEAVLRQYGIAAHSVWFKSYEHRGNKTEKYKIAVIEVSSALLERIKTYPSIRIRWQNLQVDTSTRVPRCKTCHTLGHEAKYCNQSARPSPSEYKPCTSTDCRHQLNGSAWARNHKAFEAVENSAHGDPQNSHGTDNQLQNASMDSFRGDGFGVPNNTDSSYGDALVH